MKLLVFLLSLFLAAPLAAQEKNAQPKYGAQKPEPKVEKQSGKKAAKKAEKKAGTRPGLVQKKAEPKKAAEPKQEWGRFSSQAKKDEKERAQKAEKKK